MILPKSTDAPHKVQMYRLLTAIITDVELSKVLVFKGGTCAVLRGWLDRFSIDLDFDLTDKSKSTHFREKLHDIFKDLHFEIKDESKRHLQFFLKYESVDSLRNTLKLEINDDISPYNDTEIASLLEINLLALTQTKSTMVANKLVAALGRYAQHGTIAGRDFYDLHHFLTNGYDIKKDIVEERTATSFDSYIKKVIEFLELKVTDQHLYEDLNPLIPSDRLKQTIGHLRQELLWMLRGLV